MLSLKSLKIRGDNVVTKIFKVSWGQKDTIAIND